MRIYTAAVVLLILFSPRTEADTLNHLRRGDVIRLRVQARNDRYVFVQTRPDTLYVTRRRNREPHGILFNEISRIDRQVPRTTGWGALRGMVIGGALGAGAGMAYAIATWEEVDIECGDFDELCDDTATTLQNVARLFGCCAVFGMGGMVIGTVLGAAVPGFRWQAVELPQRTGLSYGPGRALTVTYTRRF